MGSGQHYSGGYDGRFLARTASSLAKAFLSGQVHGKIAHDVQKLLPNVSYASLSLLVGDKLLITQGNLLETGRMRISFEGLNETVAGQCILQNSNQSSGSDVAICSRETADGDANGFEVVSVPISQRDRQASFEMCYLQTSAGNKMQPWSLDDLHQPLAAAHCLRKSRGPPIGSMTIAYCSGQMPLTQIAHLSDLADRLAPLLRHHCSTIITDLETIFQQEEMIGAPIKHHDCLTTMPSDSSSDSHCMDRWSSEECIDEMVDNLISRQVNQCLNCDACD